MTNTTETYWDVDGTSLQTYAWNITTLGGDRLAPPPVRGDDITVPYLQGTVFTPKVPDKRTITLGMWVQGSNPDGSVPTNQDARRSFDANWRMLQKLLWRYRKQFTLGKRFWVPTADLTAANALSLALSTEGDWSLIYAEAKASFSSGLLPSMHGPSGAAFTVDLRMTDPYFYASALTVPFSTSTVAPDPGPVQDITVLGDDRTSKINFSLTGPLDTPRFTLPNYDNAPWFQYSTSIADGDSATVDIADFSAYHTASSQTYRSSGYLNHYGDRALFYLDPGATRISLSVQSGTGTADMTYQPAFL